MACALGALLFSTTEASALGRERLSLEDSLCVGGKGFMCSLRSRRRGAESSCTLRPFRSGQGRWTALVVWDGPGFRWPTAGPRKHEACLSRWSRSNEAEFHGRREPGSQDSLVFRWFHSGGYLGERGRTPGKSILRRPPSCQQRKKPKNDGLGRPRIGMIRLGARGGGRRRMGRGPWAARVVL